MLFLDGFNYVINWHVIMLLVNILDQGRSVRNMFLMDLDNSINIIAGKFPEKRLELNYPTGKGLLTLQNAKNARVACSLEDLEES